MKTRPSPPESRPTADVARADIAAPSAMAATKSLFYKLDTLPFLDSISTGIVANADARSTPAFREGVRRFTSRKKDQQ